jgi:predicted Zn-dependent peptidase
VILQEIGQTLDTPDDIIFDWLQETAYPDQPLGRSILGPSERVAGFGVSDLSGFVGEHYAPGRIIVAAAGAVDTDAIVRKVEAAFGHLQDRAAQSEEPARFVSGEHRVEKTLEQAHFALAFEGPGYCDDEIYTAQVFSTAFGGGMSSRLFQEIREKRGLCYTIFAQTGAFSDSGLMTIYAGTSGDEVADLAKLTVDELMRAASDLSDAEVDRARAQMKAGMLMGLESPANRAERLARQLAIWGRIPSLEETVAKIDAITTADARSVAEAMAGDGRAALALYGPVAKAPELGDLTGRLVA